MNDHTIDLIVKAACEKLWPTAGTAEDRQDRVKFAVDLDAALRQYFKDKGHYEALARWPQLALIFPLNPFPNPRKRVTEPELRALNAVIFTRSMKLGLANITERC